MKFQKIYIIYNPKSTGDSKSMASELKDDLHERLPKIDCELVPTKHAGHAKKLAKDIAKKDARPLIISSSGDGGYNEVVNGVMAAGSPNAICAVLPAGNANDHSRTMHNKPLADLIVKGDVAKVDLLKVTVQGSAPKKEVMYAHSYVGLGISPAVAVELNRHNLNPLTEALIVMRTFLKYRSFKIKHSGNFIKLDSLLFANINQMAKVLKLASANRPDDGKFEIIAFPGASKWHLIRHLTKAAARHADGVKRVDNYEFNTIKKLHMQIDGEVMTIPSGAKVTVQSAHKALQTFMS